MPQGKPVIGHLDPYLLAGILLYHFPMGTLSFPVVMNFSSAL